MAELDRETQDLLWKVRALLMMRALYHKKVISIRDIATQWNITERQVFYKLEEANELFNHLRPLVLMQPDLSKEASGHTSSESLKEPLA